MVHSAQHGDGAKGVDTFDNWGKPGNGDVTYLYPLNADTNF